MSKVSYRVPVPRPYNREGFETFQKDAISVFRDLRDGKINARGNLTLTAGTATTLTSPFVHSQSVILFMPTNAAAAAIVPYVTARTYDRATAVGTATLTHATAAGTETYEWIALG